MPSTASVHTHTHTHTHRCRYRYDIFIYIYIVCTCVCVCVCVYAVKADQLEKDLKISKAAERAKDKEVDEAWKKMRC